MYFIIEKYKNMKGNKEKEQERQLEAVNTKLEKL